MRALWLGLILAVTAAAAELLAGIGTRLGWWPFTTGFTLLRYGTFAALLALPLLGWGVWRTPARAPRLAGGLGLIVAVFAAAVPLSWLLPARSLPVIHDISTDTVSPPAFVAVLPQRHGAPNPAEYGGPEVAAQQREAYPDIVPLRLSLPPAEAYALALDTARRSGWEIVAAEPESGRIEATDTTFWFGFKDDVVVRITPDAAGARVDVRSLSRVGRSDVGTNARRIRDYLGRLAEAAHAQG